MHHLILLRPKAIAGLIASLCLSAITSPAIDIPSDRSVGAPLASPGGSLNMGTTTDDGSRIKIGDIDIINNDSSHGDATVDADVNFLSAGLYPIEITYFAGDWTSDGGHNGSTNPADHGGDNFHLRISG